MTTMVINKRVKTSVPTSAAVPVCVVTPEQLKVERCRMPDFVLSPCVLILSVLSPCAMSLFVASLFAFQYEPGSPVSPLSPSYPAE